ncbi:MAG TPA: NADH-quinone oxidoreductase subunit L [Bryobacteraceae bacterium]|jgi:NADH-quinone oxidoreductase subunit L|nr:NADH-quinone oxidoreductase subunit L [Bryobacteraceae bacterium]
MQNLWLIPALPFLGFLINGLFGRKLPKFVINLVAVASVLLSFAWVMKVFMTAGDLGATPVTEHYFTWIKSGQFQVGWDFSVDKLTMIMLMIVTGIGSLIHIYSIGYMAHEEGYYRFFAYLNLFMFFMLNLVLGANYLILFVGWEGVGLCSYLLIGFYTFKQSATTAGNKAFIVNRIGDFGFSLAIFLIVVNFGTLDFTQVFSAAPGKPTGTLTAIALLLLVGACGKSAQIPLYVWLPDAMEGPTPVSALIHAATMVTAGVYMCTRSAVIFTHAPIAMETVAIIGLATAVFAATIGLAQNDIKKVFAYSTVSQLGYMFLGVGVGAFSAGIWHLMTHAFFKALLFLGAGSVIHACHGEQDMRHMGGLKKYAPWTCITLACASLAISGFPFTSGYFSKDAILSAAYGHAPWMYWVGVVTAGMTAFYVWRAFWMTFLGEYKGHGHPHESPWSMLAPLVVLAVLSIGGGFFFNVPHMLDSMFPVAEGVENMNLTYISVAFGIGGIALSYYMYVVNTQLPESIASAFGWLYKLIYNKYFIDEIYDATVVHPTIEGSRVLLWHGMDQGVIDGIVNGVGTQSKSIGGVLKLLQSGNIRSYATWVVLGAVALLVIMGVSALGFAAGVGR